MKIALYISTFNRANYVSKMAKSLSLANDFDKIDIKIFDDASNEFEIEFLQNILPSAKIHRNAENMRADKNLALMYLDFLCQDYDVFMAADSDLIFSPNFLAKIKEFLPKTKGALSIYNSNLHPFIKESTNSNLDLGLKDHIGSAGSVFTREIVEKLILHISNQHENLISQQDLDNIRGGGGKNTLCILPADVGKLEIFNRIKNAFLDNVNALDWQFSAFFKKANIELFCTKESFVQHIGILGQNNGGWLYYFDFGLNFMPIHLVNQKIMMEFTHELIYENARVIEKSRLFRFKTKLKNRAKATKHNLKKLLLSTNAKLSLLNK